MSILRRLTWRFILRLGIVIYKCRGQIARETLPRFGNSPSNLRIELPRTIINPERMFIGNDVWLGPGSFLMALTHYPTVSMEHPEKKQSRQEFNSKIIIGNRVTSTAGLQIAAMSEITVEDDVMFASNINITDGLHGYESADEPYKYQKMFRIAPIVIKRGCWIGQNVVVLPGVTIGELAIVGANSVVSNDIPARCIAVGSPARVVKMWDGTARRWVSVTGADDRSDEF